VQKGGSIVFLKNMLIFKSRIDEIGVYNNMSKIETISNTNKEKILKYFSSDGILSLKQEQSTIPILSKNKKILEEIEVLLRQLPTVHQFYNIDSTCFSTLEKESVHLVITSPPYWNLKRYNNSDKQLGHIDDYEQFLYELDKVWKICFDLLAPGGRLICVVGDVLLSRRKNNGRHMVMPLHSSIQEHCREIGYDNLSPIIWHKISNANFEVSGNTTFLGKPYEPNAIIKNDIEYLLMLRKFGGYRSPGWLERVFSVISEENHKQWFSQIWYGITGASTKNHPAPYPINLITRLIRMFSFVGDTVLDPFWGTGTTSVASFLTGRNSIGLEVDEKYFQYAVKRFKRETNSLISTHKYFIHSKVA